MNTARFDLRGIVWFSVFLAFGTFAYLLRAVDYLSAIPGDLGDARFNSVILEHVFQWVTGKVDSLWSPPFFYPFENVLAFSDNHFGSSPVYILFRQLGLSREIAFDAWFITGFVLNYVAAFVVARRLSFSPLAAATCAFVFAFALPALVKEHHAQLTYRFAIPLAFGALLQMVEARRLIAAGRVAFWTAVQFYCSIYLGVFLVYLLAATAVVALLPPDRRGVVRALLQSWASEQSAVRKGAAVVVAASLAAVAALLYKYHAVGADYGLTRSVDEIATMLPRLSSYLLADRGALSSWLGRSVQGIPMRHEHQMFVGIGVVTLIVYGATGRWSGSVHGLTRKTAVGALGIIFLMTLSVAGHSLYFGVIQLPGLGAIRAVSRIILVMLWPVALLAGLGAERLQLKLSGRRWTAKASVLALVPLLLVAEVLAYTSYRTPIADWTARQSAVRKHLTSEYGADPVLFITQKVGEPFYYPDLDSMILAQDLGMPTLNGYSGSAPPGLMVASPCTSFTDRVLAYASFRGRTDAEMADLARRVVTIERSPCADGVVSSFRGSLTADQAKGLDLQIGPVVFAERRIHATIRIINTAATSFSTRNPANPVRLSWRFVPVSRDGERLADPGWDTRQDVVWSMGQGESRNALISGALPPTPGNYLFEVSLVQEGIAWLHNLGMRVPSAQVVVGGGE